MTEQHYDAIIVGSGAGGAAITASSDGKHGALFRLVLPIGITEKATADEVIE